MIILVGNAIISSLSNGDVVSNGVAMASSVGLSVLACV